MTYALINNGRLSALVDIKFAYFMIFSIFVYFVFFTVYEIGYVINDCVATKHELRPSMRYQNYANWKYLVAAKIGFFVALILAGSMLFKTNLFILLPIGILILFLFILHNQFTLQERGLSYFWLESVRLIILPIW